MTTKRKRKGRLAPFIAVTKSIMATPTWRHMSLGARLLYIELRGHLSNDLSNNGRVYLSQRDAAEAMGVSKDSVTKWYAENEFYGFLRKTGEGFLGSDGHGIAARYRFTEFPFGTHPATRDYEKWDGELFSYTPRRPRRQKQNPVLTVRTPCPNPSDIRNDKNGASVCPNPSDIVTAPRCPNGSDISRRTTPPRSGRVKQGSSMARAPVKAGDAGSSPAPVTRSENRHD